MIFILYVILPLIISIMLYTLAERKVQGIIQHRIGPNQVGIYGLLQPLTDGLKLLRKEIIIPRSAYLIIFIISPLFSLILSIITWIVYIRIDISLNLLIIFVIGGLEIYGILLGGWASQNKYTILGSIRTTSQLISYELILSIILIIILLSTSSFRIYYLTFLPINNFFTYLPLYIISLIIILAETNRAPFDLPESESELISGFFVEHSAIIFAFYFLAEYSNMILLSSLFSLFFFGSNLFFPIHLFFYIWIRATLPRLRYDHLILLSWSHLLPISFSFFFFTFSFLYSVI